MININWSRWIFASFSQHFYNYCGTNSLPIFLEGQDRKANAQRDYVEFRIDGPTQREISKNYWDFNILINILIVSFINEEDFHKLHRNIGLISAAFTCVPIMKYGDGPDDDEHSQLGIMDVLEPDGIVVTNFGQVSSDTLMQQATVEAHYGMKIFLKG